MGTGARQAAERRRIDIRARRARSATSSSASSRPSATRAIRCGCCSRRALRRRTPSRPSIAGCARISARMRCCISARMARSNSCPASRAGLSGACWPDRLIGDSAELLSLRRQQSVRGHDRQAALGGDAGQLSDAAGRAGRALSRADRSQGLARSLARPAHREPAERDTLVRAHPGAGVDARSRRRPSRFGPARTRRACASSSHAVLELEHDADSARPARRRPGAAPDERIDLLLAVAEALSRRAARARVDQGAGRRRDAEIWRPRRRGLPPDETTQSLFAESGKHRRRCWREDHELPALIACARRPLHAAGPGGDLLRNPQVLPTGRNLHGFDPFRIPSAFAVEGRRAAGGPAARAPPRRRTTPSRSRSPSCCGAPTI